MKEELTTAMHEELIGHEIPHLDLMIMSVYGAISQGMPLTDALIKYGVDEKSYSDNIDRVLSTP